MKENQVSMFLYLTRLPLGFNIHLARTVNWKIHQVEIIDLDEDDTNISPSDYLPTKHEVREKFVMEIFFSMSRGRERAIQAAEKFKPKNPSFMDILRPHNMVSLYT